MQYTLEQILKMAPDDSSSKAGQQLANNAKWPLKCVHEQALWGDCQGSGKTPYKTIIDLSNIAFKCSCPSRKFPCKHGLGLLLLYAQQATVFSKEENLAPHVAEWLNKREAKETTKEKNEDKPIDEAAKAKRAESREKKVNNGIEELRAWLKDTVRGGIAHIPKNIYQFNQNITARMVDAQANGLANQLRQINKIDYFKEGWQQKLIKRLAKIYLITEAYQNQQNLTPAYQQEIKSIIGWTTLKEEVLTTVPINDTWVVLSVTNSNDNNINTEHIWLYGKNSQKFGLILNFYAGNQLPQHLLYGGLHIEASMVYFPALIGLRALIKEQKTINDNVISIVGHKNVQQIYEIITDQLVQNPFTEQIPFILSDIFLVLSEEVWWIKDVNNQGFTINNTEDECWSMLAFVQEKSFSCFGIYEDEQFHIQSIWANNLTYFVK